MTKTTNIDALRERMMQQREAELTGKTPTFEECELLVCDLLRALTLSNNQLEAVRQRADELELSNDRIRQRWVGEVSNNCDAGKRVNELEAELAALRGTQEPVAQVADSFIFFLRKQEGGEPWPVGTKLFTHPAKPVVALPKAVEVCQFSHKRGLKGQNLYAHCDIVAALEAACIVVKDDEQTSKTVCDHDWELVDDGEYRFYGCTKCNSTT